MSHAHVLGVPAGQALPEDQGPPPRPLLPGLAAALAADGLTRQPLTTPALELLVSLLLPSCPPPGSSHSADTGRSWLLGALSWAPSLLSLCPVFCGEGGGSLVTRMVSGVIFIQVASKPSSRGHHTPDSAHQTYCLLTISTWIS